MNGRGLHLTLLIAGALVQAFAAFNVPWIDPYRAGLLGLSGTLLMMGAPSRAFGRVHQADTEDTKP